MIIFFANSHVDLHRGLAQLGQRHQSIQVSKRMVGCRALVSLVKSVDLRDVDGLLAAVCHPVRLKQVCDTRSPVWVLLQHALYHFLDVGLWNQREVDLVVQDGFLEDEWVGCVAEWELASQKLVEGDPESPDVGLLASDHSRPSHFRRHHLWREEGQRTKRIFEQDQVLLLYQAADPEIDQHCLQVVVQHDVLGFYVSMDNFDDVVAVVEGLEHVNEVEAHSSWLETLPLLGRSAVIGQLELSEQ